MLLVVETLFWICVGALGYTYVLYPPAIWALSRVFGQHATPPKESEGFQPTVTLLIVAHNEEKYIARRIENALQSDYPPQKLEVLVASDGSTDRTVAIVKSFADPRVRCLEFAQRRGKAATLKAAAPSATGSILVLSDANSFFEPRAIRKLVRWFADPKVGSVCGRLRLQDGGEGKNCDGIYWRFETMLKQSESRLGALLGSNGAIYALRPELVSNLPTNSIVDDFELPLASKLKTGCDLLFEPEAIADEETPVRIAHEFGRRARIGAGAFQSLERLYPLLDPRRGWIAFTFFSHKVLRWFGPFLLFGALIANAFLVSRSLYGALFALQLFFYLAALLGYALPQSVLPRVLRIPALFTTLNAALLFGFVRWALGRQSGVWNPTKRQESILSR